MRAKVTQTTSVGGSAVVRVVAPVSQLATQPNLHVKSVSLSNSLNLDDLADVNAATAATGDALFFQNGEWRPKSGVVDQQSLNSRLDTLVASSRYEHTQTIVSAIWTVNHNLGFYPNATVFSVGRVEVEAQIVDISVNQTVIYFNQAQAGYARFN